MNHPTMKRTILALAAALALSLTACSRANSSVPAQDASPSPAQSETAAPVTPAEPAAPAEPDTPEEPVAAETPAAPDAPAEPERTISNTMLLGGEEKTVYLDISDTEILLWDSASGGQLVAAARFPEPMPGAVDALQSCDFTDLDADGTSDLTASFSFPDGASASLLWFYADGGFIYNEEFSLLPGDAPAAGAQ